MELSSIISLFDALMMLIVTSKYCYDIARHKIEPNLAMWLLFALACSISLVTFIFSGNRQLTSATAIALDALFTWSGLLVILLSGNKAKRKFNAFENVCIYGSVVILIFWGISQLHVASNVISQVIISIAYFPTYKNLWKNKENTDSFSFWTFCLIATICGIAISCLNNDWLALSYSFRGMVLVSIILALMIRIKVKDSVNVSV